MAPLEVVLRPAVCQEFPPPKVIDALHHDGCHGETYWAEGEGR